MGRWSKPTGGQSRLRGHNRGPAVLVWSKRECCGTTLLFGQFPRGEGLATDGRPLDIRCAWCERERLPALGDDRRPSHDTDVSHGICKRHADMMLADLPSRSFPGIRILVVVRPGHAALCEYLESNFTGVAGVHVIMDRRRADRRQRPQYPVIERRRRDRRRRNNEVSAFGHTVVRFGV